METKTKTRIGIVCGSKATDALLCAALEKAGFELTIVHQKIPLFHIPAWLTKRIRDRGLGVLLGHFGLSFYIRAARLYERTIGSSVWSEITNKTPSWSKVKSPRMFSFSEHTTISKIKSADLILILDSFRFSHKMFRVFKRPILQVVWGSVPEYIGDSGGYWAYLSQDPVSVSVIVRTSQFNRFTVLAQLPVEISETETVRTVKVKQADVLVHKLSEIIRNALSFSIGCEAKQATKCRQFYAPTLFTSLQNQRGSMLPKYAFREQDCFINTSD